MSFYFIHVPKTGGFSLRTWAKKNRVRWLEGGHVAYSERVIPKNMPVLTCLRCPIKHTISVYAFWNTQKDLLKKYSHEAPFSEWLRAQKELVFDWPSGKWHWFPNLYTSFFGDGDFDKAVSVLSSLEYIFDTSHLIEQFNVFTAKHKLPTFNLHVNTSFGFEISEDDKNYIRKQREEDFEICKKFGITTL